MIIRGIAALLRGDIRDDNAKSIINVENKKYISSVTLMKFRFGSATEVSFCKLWLDKQKTYITPNTATNEPFVTFFCS